MASNSLLKRLDALEARAGKRKAVDQAEERRWMHEAAGRMTPEERTRFFDLLGLLDGHHEDEILHDPGLSQAVCDALALLTEAGSRGEEGGDAG